ncbi:MAG: glyoxylate/hydroxypyruvate reductase A, partial [Rhodospirillales bacterium]|nr:glyoxylate/hydroxypyruvate reductase A [Rhodospirillales bacterium]
MALLLMNMLRGEPDEWRSHFEAAFPGMDIRFWPDLGAPEDIEYLIFGRPELDKLPPLPGLKLMLTMLAGVERLIGSPILPDVPLVRAEPAGGDPMMNEYAVSLALYHHRNFQTYRAQQAEHVWKAAPSVATEERRIGVMGYGILSSPVVEALAGLNFDMAVWTRSPRENAPVQVFHGPDGLKPFLARTDICICMLPLTPETRGILNAQAFADLPQGGAVINLGRGGHMVTEDLIAALDSGHLAAASTDVTEPEPLPADSPLWDHPKVQILPHVARRPSVALTA